MYKCPFPACGHVAAYAILNSHAKSHGFKTVAEMCKEHGPVTQPKMDPKKLRTATKEYRQIHINSYNNIDTALSRMKNPNRGELKNREV